MPSIRRALVLLALTILLATPSCAQPGGSADIDRLIEYVETDQSYAPETRAQLLESDLPRLRERAPEMSDAEFFLAAARVVAQADNGHSNVLRHTIVARFDLVPIRIYWFTDGPHVVRAAADHADLLGGRIVAISGSPIDGVERRMKAFHGGTSEHFRAYYAPIYLLAPALLHAEGITPDPDRLALTLRFADGTERTVTLQADPETDRFETVAPWRTLHPAPLPGEGRSWRSVLSAASDDHLPLYLGEPDRLFRDRMLDENILYLQLRSNYAEGDRSVRAYLDELRPRLIEKTPTHLVLDMRQNPGGDLSRSAQFMIDLPDLLPPEGRVVVLTGNATFSAGIYSSFYPKAAAPDRTIVLGERVGDRERFWAESGKTIRLAGGFALTTSRQVHDIGAGCFDATICHMVTYPDDWNLAVGSLDPDVTVATTFADYAARRDPPLETALEMLGE